MNKSYSSAWRKKAKLSDALIQIQPRRSQFSYRAAKTLYLYWYYLSFRVRVESTTLDASVLFAGLNTIDSDAQKLCPDIFPFFGRDTARLESSWVARGGAALRSGTRCER
jgi:hypothetical protein